MVISLLMLDVMRVYGGHLINFQIEREGEKQLTWTPGEAVKCPTEVCSG